jgi:hypothetical protein
MVRSFCILLACTLCAGVQAQQQSQRPDSVVLPPAGDSVIVESVQEPQVIEIESYAERFNPRKALFYAAVLPGSGQVYNRKFWKVPLVYGGFAVGVYSVNFYQKIYIEYKDQLFQILNDPAGTKGVSSSGLQEAQLRNIVDKAVRQRNFWLILNGFWYMLQMVDAHVDAHLKEFELNPQLKVSIEPQIENNVMTGRTTGLAFTFKF